jgi:hypothetical protein
MLLEASPCADDGIASIDSGYRRPAGNGIQNPVQITRFRDHWYTQLAQEIDERKREFVALSRNKDESVLPGKRSSGHGAKETGAVQPREIQVEENDEPPCACTQAIERFGPVTGFVDGVTRVLESEAHRLADALVVINNQHLRYVVNRQCGGSLTRCTMSHT